MMFLSYTNNLISKHFQYHTRVIAVDSISFVLSFCTCTLLVLALTLFPFSLVRPFDANDVQSENHQQHQRHSHNNHPVAQSRQAFYSWFEMNSASFYVPHRSNSPPRPPPTYSIFPSISHHRHSHCRLLLVPSISHSISTVLGHFLA